MGWSVLPAFLAGLVQGVAEWLPVSSKTLLLLIFLLWGLGPGDSYLLGLLLNGSTILAATVYFRRRLWEALRAFPGTSSSEGARLFRFLLASIAATAALGVPLASFSASALLGMGAGEAMLLVGLLLAVTAFMNWWRVKVGGGLRSAEGVGALEGFAAGAAQAFSALPGVSRSGVTVLALMLMGFRPRDALILSFLMGIPASLGGSLYALASSPPIIGVLGPVELAVASASACLISIPIISALLRLSERFRAHVFAAALSALTILGGLALLG